MAKFKAGIFRTDGALGCPALQNLSATHDGDFDTMIRLNLGRVSHSILKPPIQTVNPYLGDFGN